MNIETKLERSQTFETASYLQLSGIEAVSTAHASGTKKILSRGRPDLTRITQIAWGCLQPTERVAEHKHADMDECFFFTGGHGSMKIGGKNYPLSEGVFMTVPAGTEHALICNEETLTFFYFGLQVY